MNIDILNRYTNAVLFAIEAENQKAAVEKAVNALANLMGANLMGADLRGANLMGANLMGANLRGANLRGADLRGADLRGANLRGANLMDADLRGADLMDADLRGADLRGADLRDADLRGADLMGANHNLEVPLVENIDAKILAAIELNKSQGLDMSVWHGEEDCNQENWCDTTHCRAGFAICMAGKAGFDLERKVGAATAGMLIYMKSTPNEPVPDFYATNDDALADIRARAEKQEAEGRA